MADSIRTTTTTSQQAAPTPVRAGFWRATLALTAKDVRAELRGRELINAMLLYSVLSVLIFSFALELDRAARATSIAGVFWVTVIYSGMLGLNRSLASEKDRGTLDALLLAPIPRGALFFGKLFSNLLFMLVVAGMLLVLVTVLFNISMFVPWLLIVILLGTVGFGVVGTLLSSMTIHARARETMLPILLLPVTLPIILTAVKASTAILAGTPQEDWIAWPQMLFVADLILVALAYVLFDFVVEE